MKYKIVLILLDSCAHKPNVIGCKHFYNFCAWITSENNLIDSCFISHKSKKSIAGQTDRQRDIFEYYSKDISIVSILDIFRISVKLKPSLTVADYFIHFWIYKKTLLNKSFIWT
jgi:hypothetical protein